MRDVRIGFEKNSGFVSKLIRFFTNGDVDHVAIEFDSQDWGGSCVFEASLSGVVVVPSRNRKWHRLYRIKYDGIQEDVREASKYIGERYDFAGLVLFAPLLVFWRTAKRVLGKLLKINFKKPTATFKGQICSELVARVLKRKFDLGNSQWVHPKELDELCRARPDFFEKEIYN